MRLARLETWPHKGLRRKPWRQRPRAPPRPFRLNPRAPRGLIRGSTEGLDATDNARPPVHVGAPRP
eukprot:6193053-Pyramimonas_sp.AAC.1